jgi:hypothetical protein
MEWRMRLIGLTEGLYKLRIGGGITFIARSGEVPTTSETLLIFIHYLSKKFIGWYHTFCSFLRLHVSSAQ